MRLSLYQATLPLKGSDFGFKGCLCVSIAPALQFGLVSTVYPPNNFPVSTISGDVGGGRQYDGGNVSDAGNMDTGTGGSMGNTLTESPNCVQKLCCLFFFFERD